MLQRARILQRLRRIPTVVPLTFSLLLVLGALLAIGVMFERQGRTLLEEHVKDKLKTAATLAAMQFDGDAVASIEAGDTVQSSPALAETVRQLRAIRDAISGVRFAYIMRRTDDPEWLAFVADADIGLPDLALDRNANGIVDDDERPSHPGDPYKADLFPVLRDFAFQRPAVDEVIGKDDWGSVISGYAPILDQSGVAVAALGIDMEASDFLRLSHTLVSPVVLLLVVLSIVSIGAGTFLFINRRRLEMLRRLDVERSGLLRLAFHQLGGPLTIIRWSLEELQEVGSPEDRRTIANIEEGLKRLMGILKTLKDADQVHSGKLQAHQEIVALSSVIESAVKQVGAKMAMRRQTIVQSLDATLRVTVDQSLLCGVIEELLTNAIDYSPDRSDITIASSVHGSMAECTITDHGHGIPAKDLPRIFGEFVRASNATQYKADGNGLGLYIVKGIIEHAGGSIDIESVEGKGTTVRLRLPLA